MTNCKHRKIYKFYYATPMNTDKQHAENWKRAEEYNKFKRDLIDKFSPENYAELAKYTVWADALNIPRVQYSKTWLHSQMDIGIDMLSDTYGIEFELQWSSMYIGIPLDAVDIIAFFESNKPSWVTTVKRI